MIKWMLAILLIISLLYGHLEVMVMMGDASMRPNLRNGDIIVAWDKEPNVGDVVVYSSGQFKRNVVHRVIEIDGRRVITKGDSNHTADKVFLSTGDVKVVAVHITTFRKLYGFLTKDP